MTWGAHEILEGFIEAGRKAIDKERYVMGAIED
jgi:hypothetical protein